MAVCETVKLKSADTFSNCNVKISTEKETFFSHIFISKISYSTLLYHVLSSVFKLVMSDKNKIIRKINYL